MEASTVGQRQSVTVTTDADGNGVQEVQGVPPDQVLDPQFDDEGQSGDLSVESSTDGHAAIRVTDAPPNSSVVVTYASAEDQSGAGKEHLQELQRLRDDGILSQEDYDAAAAKVNEGQPPDQAFRETQADRAATQSPGESQVVPEVRPQAAVSPGPGNVSDASKRIDGGEAMGPGAYDRANSEDQMKTAADNSRKINLLEGQRVVIIGDHPEEGRMAYVLGIHYTDGIQDMIAKSGSSEARFAEVDHYVLRTRDGRSDLLTATPDQVKPIEENQGWGRGQI